MYLTLGPSDLISRKTDVVWGVGGESGVQYEKEREKNKFQNTKNLHNRKWKAQGGATFTAIWKD